MTRPSPLLRSIAAFGLPGSTSARWPAGPLEPDDWSALIAEATEQRVWPLLAECVRAGVLLTTTEQATTAFSHDDDAVNSCLHLDRVLHAVYGAMDELGIDVRVFKGVSSAAQIYPRPGLRSYSDVDLLVPGADFDHAASILATLGGRRHHPDPKPGFTAAAGKSAGYTLDGGWEIDLHRSPQGGPFGAAVRTDELFSCDHHHVMIAGRPVRTLTPAQLFLIACYHAILPADERRLVPLLDVAYMIGWAALDGDDVIDTAQRWRGSIVVAEAVIEASRSFELGPSPLLRWAEAFMPSRREVRWLRVTRDRRPSAVVAMGAATAVAYPRWSDRLRFVQAQVLHDDRLPVRSRIKRLGRRVLGGSKAFGLPRGGEANGPRTVVQVVDSLAAGGAERMAVDVSNGLAERGWEVHLVVTRALGPLVDDVSASVQVHDLARRSRWDLAGLWSFRQITRRTATEVVHAHGWSSLSFATAGLAGRLRPPSLLFHDHLGRSASGSRRANVPVSFVAAAWVSVRAHVAVDGGLLQPPLRTRCRSIAAVVANGVPLDRFVPKTSTAIESPAKLVAVANLRPPKDHETLLRAIAGLQAEGRTLELHLIGGGTDLSYLDRCEVLIRDLGLAEVVHFRGTVATVGEELAGFDAGVLSSRAESGPIALIEYLATGLPFVVTDVGEIPERLPARLRQWVVPPGDVSALAATIGSLLDLAEADRHEFAAEGRAFVERELSIERTVDELVGIYDEMRSRRS